MATGGEPPSYLEAATTSSSRSPPLRNSALPTGMFLVQNRAHGKTLDLLGHSQADGARLGLHPVKQPTLDGLSLQHAGNNQLFFLDWHGHLHAAAASRPVDVDSSNGLILKFARPIEPYPTPQSHPLPTFHLDPDTHTLEVKFAHDPTYPPPLHPTAASTSDFDQYDYLVEAVPVPFNRRRPRIYDGIEGFLGRVGGTLNPFSSSSAASSSLSHAVAKKRLPRDRDASLPPPPIPLKDDAPAGAGGDVVVQPPPSSPPLPPRVSLPTFPFEESSPLSISPTALSPATTTKKIVSAPVVPRRRSSASSVRTSTTITGDGDATRTNRRRARDPRDLNNNGDDDEEDDDEKHESEGKRRERDDADNVKDKGEHDEDEDSDDDEDDDEGASDDDPRAYRPVRVVRLLKSSNWREREFPFGRRRRKSHPSGDGDDEDDVGVKVQQVETDNVGTKASEGPPIGLGFRDTRSSSKRRDDRQRGSGSEDDDEERDSFGVGVENVWPESHVDNDGHRARETSFASTSTCLDAPPPPPSPLSSAARAAQAERRPADSSDSNVNHVALVESAAAKRRRERARGKEMRKWRRRQWDVVPVCVEPVPARSTGASWRVRHELEDDMYGFQGELSDGDHVCELDDDDDDEEDEDEDEDDVLEEHLRGTARAPGVQGGKRGSIETVRSVVSGVGSFITTRLLWSASTSSTPHAATRPFGSSEVEADLPALPLHAEEEYHEDAREVRSDELERLATRNRRKSSATSRSRSAAATSGSSPLLPDLPAVPSTPIETPAGVGVPLPDSLPPTPVLGSARAARTGLDEEKEVIVG